MTAREGFLGMPALFRATLFDHGFLVRQLAEREIRGRYQGAALELSWVILNPLMMLALYTFVFGVVFKARFPAQAGDHEIDFALVLFAGLIVHGVMADCLSRAPTLVVANANYVKKVVFPLEVLCVVVLAGALFHAAVSLAILVAGMLVTGQAPGPWALALPIVWLPLVLTALGLSWGLAALGVFLRDLEQLIRMVVMLLLFVSPVFYPLEAVPDAFRPIIDLNPISPIVTATRDVVLWNRAPDWGGLAIQGVFGAAVAWLGLYFFARTKRSFADVL